MSGKTVINFGPGPGKLPKAVLEHAQSELLNYKGTGISVLETSHRSPEFLNILNTAENNLRQLLNIPGNYRVLFLQGGGQGEFAAVPLNLLPEEGGSADYMVTGAWSEKAFKEGAKFGQCKRVLPPGDLYENIPDKKLWSLDPKASYLYYCDNETIHGIEFPCVPESPDGVPLVADMSSNILSRPLDVTKFGLIFASAQKNIGPAGCTLVIVRDDILGKVRRTCPSILDYTAMSKASSILNTPPVFGIYMMGLVFKWILDEGGVDEMERRNIKKSDLLYSCINDSQGFYSCTVAEGVRSRMNVCFRVGGREGDEEMEKKFVTEAKAQGIISIKGHRSVGGMRASLYNALTYDEVSVLVEFMKNFQKKYNKK